MRAWAGLLLLLGAMACAVSAQCATHKLAQTTQHRHAVRRQAFHMSAEMRDDGKGSTASYASRAPGERRLNPSFETRINELGKGAVASFGYHPSIIRRTLDPQELDGAAQTRLGHDESSAGVSVKVPL